MYVCIYMYVCSIYVCMYIIMYVCIYVCSIYVCMYICMYTDNYVCMYSKVWYGIVWYGRMWYICIYMHVCMYL